MAFGNAIVGGGNKLIRDNIESSNYVPGASGWSINRDGSAEFQDVLIRGELDVPTMSGVQTQQVSSPGFAVAGSFQEFTNAEWPYIQYTLPASGAIEVFMNCRGRSTASAGDSLIMGHRIYHGGVQIQAAETGVDSFAITPQMSSAGPFPAASGTTPSSNMIIYWEAGALPGPGETIEIRPSWRIGVLGVPANHNINSGKLIVKGAF